MSTPSSSAVRALALEYKSLQEEPVEGFRVKLLNDDNLFEWEVAIFGPPDTLYQGGYFKVSTQNCYFTSTEPFQIYQLQNSSQRSSKCTNNSIIGSSVSDSFVWLSRFNRKGNRIIRRPHFTRVFFLMWIRIKTQSIGWRLWIVESNRFLNRTFNWRDWRRFNDAKYCIDDMLQLLFVFVSFICFVLCALCSMRVNEKVSAFFMAFHLLFILLLSLCVHFFLAFLLY